MSSPLVHNLYKGLKLGVFTHDDKRCMFTLVFCSHNPAYVHTIRSFKLKGNEADFIFLCSQLFWFVLYLTQIFFFPHTLVSPKILKVSGLSGTSCGELSRQSLLKWDVLFLANSTKNLWSYYT